VKFKSNAAMLLGASILVLGLTVPRAALAITGGGGSGQTTWYVNFTGSNSTIYDPSALIIALNQNTGLDQFYTAVAIGDQVAEDALLGSSTAITFVNPVASLRLTPVGVIMAGVDGGTTFGPGSFPGANAELYSGPTNSTGVVLGVMPALAGQKLIGNSFSVMVDNFAANDTTDTEASVISGIQNTYQGNSPVYSDTFFMALNATAGAYVPVGASGEFVNFSGGADDGSFGISSSPLPEPGTLGLLAVGGISLLARRKRL